VRVMQERLAPISVPVEWDYQRRCRRWIGAAPSVLGEFLHSKEF
jgi:hypothetical protein